jgi:hypothetical protein
MGSQTIHSDLEKSFGILLKKDPESFVCFCVLVD